MSPIWIAVVDEIGREFPDAHQLVRVVWRLSAAVLLSAVLGWNRERGHKTAGLRTHMLVALGSALMIVASADSTGNTDITRVVQGIAAGIGFVGGGAVLKMEHDHRVRGLTTASSIWTAAAIGVAAGLGRVITAAVGMAFAYFILVQIEKLKERIEPESRIVHPSVPPTPPSEG